MLPLSAWLIGIVFGLGLVLSGMTDPAKVLGFLDLAGSWDPSLGLVMGGAIAVAAIPFAIAKRRPTSLLGAPTQLPSARRIDQRLVVGSIVFGIGWGIAGFCPGPALASLGTGAPKAVVFVLAMLVGMGLFELIDRVQRGSDVA
jgi:uncharacterized protein